MQDIISDKFSDLGSKEVSNIILKAWSCLSKNYKTKYRMKKNILKKIFDILNDSPSQMKKKISDNFYLYPQYPTQSHNLIKLILFCALPILILIDVVLDVMNSSGNDATELVKQFQLILSKFGLAHKNIVNITNDNCDVKVLLTQIKIKIILCLTNILRISIELGLSCINDILDKSKKLIEVLINDTNRKKLRNIQQQIDQTIQQLLDVIDVKEDWNSIYHANHQLIKLQLPI
ncbi:12734_t:CDS:2 [Cetraspora pellucida]|uniref:12734_t:CDS:1 n=1 Tax=Cetraspora pellucida TaxID=1433469 RepID=A0A9N9ABU8_9GLOM|nr:12734_t:CDS:2 [Cetraspora pellucida]